MAEDSHSGDSLPEEATSTAAETRSAGGVPRSQGGVFGNLPDSRPGTRSPRRRSSDGTTADAARAVATDRVREARAQSASPKRGPVRQPTDAPQPPPPASRAEGGGGIEDLAWAGVAAAAEAATLGVRLASRALDALRGNAERD